MLKLENSIRGLSFSRVAFDLTIQDIRKEERSHYEYSFLFIIVIDLLICITVITMYVNVIESIVFFFYPSV